MPTVLETTTTDYPVHCSTVTASRCVIDGSFALVLM
jgi:hypothetical protein